MRADEITMKMEQEMPFHPLAIGIRPYIYEAMELYATNKQLEALRDILSSITDSDTSKDIKELVEAKIAAL